MKPGDKVLWVHRSRVNQNVVTKEAIYMGESRKRDLVRIRILGRLGGALDRIVRPETIKAFSA